MATKTQQVIYEMMCENTGRHLLDSGDFYGRHYDQNRTHTIEDFIASPTCTLRPAIYGDRLELEVTKSLFHHLVDALDYCEELDELWQRFDATYPDDMWSETMDRFYKWAKEHSSKYHDCYDFDGEHYSEYTYNGDNILSQDFIFYVMGSYVFIQTHNGCDARGGFSRPRLFQFDLDKLMSYDDYTIGCKNGHWWDFQDGYEQTEQPMNLLPDKYSRIPCAGFTNGDSVDFLEVEGQFEQQLREWKAAKRAWELSEPLPGMDKPDFAAPPELMAGKVLVKDGKAYCPICGEELEAWSY